MEYIPEFERKQKYESNSGQSEGYLDIRQSSTLVRFLISNHPHLGLGVSYLKGLFGVNLRGSGV